MKHRRIINIISAAAVAILVSMAVVCPASAKAVRYTRMDTVQTRRQIQGILSKYNANALVVINKGKTAYPRYLYHQSTDAAALPRGQQRAVKPTPNKLFPIASMQKMMTGILVQQLINQGKISLSDSIGKYYPGFPHGQGTTVQELMTHQSGIKDVSPKDSPTLLSRQADQLAFTMAHLASKGNSNWKYANANFTLLAGIVSQVTHQTYQKRLNHLIIRPLREEQNMKYANRVMKPNRVLPVLPLMNWNYPLLQAAWSGSMGADEMLVTPKAYWKFINVFNKGGFVPLKDYTSHRNLSPTNYYGGVYIRGHYLHSNGYSHGYACMFFTSYRTHETIMIFCNNLPYAELKAIGTDLFQAYFKRPYPLSTIGTV